MIEQEIPIKPWTRAAIRIQYLRGLFAYLRSYRVPKEPSFVFQGETYRYFLHRYNFTAFNERKVEIPLAFRALQNAGGLKVLEVGNVLSHYFPDLTHEIVDKYEKSKTRRIIPEDARDFQARHPYDLILSISTLEHVGWDETPQNFAKAVETIRHLKSLLAPNGVLIFTVPAHYHPTLDRDLLAGRAGLSQLFALRRISPSNLWRQCEPSSLSDAQFAGKYPFANGLYVGVSGEAGRYLQRPQDPADQRREA